MRRERLNSKGAVSCIPSWPHCIFSFAGAENAKLLVSTDLQVIKADIDGSNDDIVDASMDVSQATEESNGVYYNFIFHFLFKYVPGENSLFI